MDGVEQHHELLQKLHVGIIVHAPDTQIVFSNRRASELLGLSQDQMHGKVALDPAWCFINEDGETVSPADYPVSRVIATREPLMGWCNIPSVNSVATGVVRLSWPER